MEFELVEQDFGMRHAEIAGLDSMPAGRHCGVQLFRRKA